ncbi:unnamed protein product [Prunus armeniaca]
MGMVPLAWRRLAERPSFWGRVGGGERDEVIVDVLFGILGIRASPAVSPARGWGGGGGKVFQQTAQAQGRCGTHQPGLARRQLLPEVQNEGGDCSATVSATAHYSIATVPR